MKPGDTFLLTHCTNNRPDMATIVRIAGFNVVMEGIYKGKILRFFEHESRFSGKKPRWAKQLSLFDIKTESKLAKKYLI